jgi:hypothetical protein
MPATDLRNPRFYMDDGEMAPVLANPALFAPREAR